MKTIELQFKGYFREANKSSIPNVSGVYCVYSCVYNETNKSVSIKSLLYIGESKDLHDRIANHDRLEDWMSSLLKGQILCYSYSKVQDADRERAEAALIFTVQPEFNDEHKDQFIYEDTEIKTNGKNKFLPGRIVLKKGQKK